MPLHHKQLKRPAHAVTPFGANAEEDELTIFNGNSKSFKIDDHLNSSYRRGWGAIGSGVPPTMQDFNAMAYALSYQISYLYQVGVAEFDDEQHYFMHDQVRGSNGNLYKSLFGDETTPNLGNDPVTDATKWQDLSTKTFAQLQGGDLTFVVRSASNGNEATNLNQVNTLIANQASTENSDNVIGTY